MSHDTSSSNGDDDMNPMDLLLAKLSEQSAVINKQHDALVEDTSYSRTVDYVNNSSGSSAFVTPATELFESTAPSTGLATPADDGGTQLNAVDVLRLQLELQQAKGKIARMDEELTQTRITKHTIEQAIGTASEADFPLNQPHDVGHLHNLNTTIRPPFGRDNSWSGQEDARSDTSDALSAGGFNRARAIWSNNGSYPGVMPSFQGPQSAFPHGAWVGRGFSQQFAEHPMSFAPSINGFRGDHLMPDIDSGMASSRDRRIISRNNNRYTGRNAGALPYAASSSSFEGLTPASLGYGSVAGMAGGVSGAMSGTMSMGMSNGASMEYHPQPIGTPLSPFAPEFTIAGGTWKNDVSPCNGENVGNTGTLIDVNQAIATEGQTYLPTTEPLNYRRLLDRTVNCNWKYIVDKIVCNNDQQASIFLQQKLKLGTTEQKYDIVEAIVAQAYPLMINRFGNFLVQRCFEHGTPEQVIKIAEAIRGNTLNLSMDAFGCHVVQKAFDSVPEDYKAIMVHELLRRIPETVIHRYACHVWQKLFELRWTESPPQIMKYVNEALRGMWHEVALGETGSLVVQNIFENCLEEDKRPCIEEVLASIDIVAHGQFGNWCIQHICEHGAPADRSRAIDHVIRYASEYSMDQFASKVVEKCLKIGGVEFLGRYLDRVCEGRHDRPRIPLIDIASDQYGNYLIQYILTNSNPQHREIVACHIRKHMVSLRGSKFGSRVGMLCTNPAVATRPGPGVGPAIGTRLPQNPRYGGAYR